MNFFPLSGEPALLDDKFTPTTPSPNHMKHAVSFRGFHNEHFKALEIEIPLNPTTQLLQVLTKQICTATVSGRQIHPV